MHTIWLRTRTLQCSTGYFLAFSAILERMLLTQSRPRDCAVKHRSTKSSESAWIRCSSPEADVGVALSVGVSLVPPAWSIPLLAFDRWSRSIWFPTVQSRPASAPTRRMQDRGSRRSIENESDSLNSPSIGCRCRCQSRCRCCATLVGDDELLPDVFAAAAAAVVIVVRGVVVMSNSVLLHALLRVAR